MQMSKSSLGKSAAALVVLFIIAGCAGYQPPNQPAVPVGSQVELNLSSDVPVDQNGVFIQNQRVVSKAQIDQGQVFCQVVMNDYQKAGGQQMKVEPGRFTVRRVRLYNHYVYNPVIYANTADNFYLPSFGIDYRTELHLQSNEQPDVVALHCTEHRLKYERRASYPDRSHFNAALGDFVTFP